MNAAVCLTKASERSEILRMKAIHVLVDRHGSEHPLGVNVRRQGKLDEKTVDIVAVQGSNCCHHIFGFRAGFEADFAGLHPTPCRGGFLECDVLGAVRAVAHHEKA
mmetsp:Transcript_66619/g.150451  ORF Transcript_66619/g.150451 Transcript_66619/m.150451 type:complete len:106 (+) Transcript_66619:666-983(+)